jgi:hypothetical protein
MDGTPLVPAPVYGLRAWRVLGEPGAERLAGPQQGAAWPTGGEWLEAVCSQTPEHAAPVRGCGCGLHAWHPTRRFARKILSGRGEIPGLVEARGAIEVHEDGFRAERARPFALMLAPGRNEPRVRRLAEAYGARVVEVAGADDVLAYCRQHGLGLDDDTITRLLGVDGEERRRAGRRKLHTDALRVVAAIVISVLLVVIGLRVATDPKGDRILNGRTGPIHVHH